MKVSVLLMTYNHARFIADALDSVLMQETSFPFEIIISEDCSTDGTREIVKAYHNQYSEKLRLILSERNIASNAIVVRGIEAARGQYVALLDGDDYWVSPHKLQQQVELLDQHPECSICFHNARVIHDDGSKEPWLWNPADQPEITALKDILLDNYIATSTTMFRKGLFDHFPAWYDSFFPITDWALHILNAEHGKIAYINEVMGVYRYHSGGCYSPLSQAEKQAVTLEFMRRLNVCLHFKYDRIIKTGISKYFIEWAEEYLRQGDIKAARRSFELYLTGRPINGFVSIKRMIILFVQLYCSWISFEKPSARPN